VSGIGRLAGICLYPNGSCIGLALPRQCEHAQRFSGGIEMTVKHHQQAQRQIISIYGF
jgi:hypothetical protein